MTVVKNAKLSCFDEKADKVVIIENGVIKTVTDSVPENAEDVIDAKGNILYRGLCDIHTHGAHLVDFSHATPQQIASLEDWYSSCGVSYLFPTTATMPYDDIVVAVKNIKKASELVTKIEIAGIHIEGPFLCYERRGAHNEEMLRNPDKELVDAILKEAGSLKIRFTVAPELEGALDFIEYCTQKGVEVTMGHSVADSETCMKAIEKGANCVTHTFNGMNPLHHREPGVLGTALAEDIYAEMICDGVHVCSSVVKMFSKAKGKDKAVLITDSVLLCGCEEGTSVLSASGMEEKMIDGKIMNVQYNCLAGSSLALKNGVKNYMNFAKVSLDEAVKCASENPLECVGLDSDKYSLKQGNKANLVLFDADGNLVMTLFGGKTVYKA